MNWDMRMKDFEEGECVTVEVINSHPVYGRLIYLGFDYITVDFKDDAVDIPADDIYRIYHRAANEKFADEITVEEILSHPLSFNSFEARPTYGKYVEALRASFCGGLVYVPGLSGKGKKTSIF